MAGPSAVAVEDYLKAIYAHTEWQSAPITSSQLAARLEVVPSSVTEMVKKLASKGYVDHVPYGAITLLPAGRELALKMIRRHRLVETWLVRQFAYSWDEVHDEAEILEHAVSDRFLDAMDDALGHPRIDPHGDPIPDRDGRVELPAARRADELVAGERATVLRISDRDPDTLRRLTAAGIDVGGIVTREELGEAATQVWVSLP